MQQHAFSILIQPPFTMTGLRVSTLPETLRLSIFISTSHFETNLYFHSTASEIIHPPDRRENKNNLINYVKFISTPSAVTTQSIKMQILHY